MSSRSSSSAGELNTAKILAWSRGLETFERMDFVYLLMHSLFPTELRYIHGIIDGLLKRDESLYTNSVHQANDFARLSHFYEGHDPQSVIGNDGLRRQFIVDLSALHPLNFYCADIFFGVLQRAELGTWTFNRDNQKVLRELILITTMVARHAAFRFDNRLYIWNIARILSQKLKTMKMAEEMELNHQDTEEIEPVLHHSNSDSIEFQSTLTTSGADRLPNGYSEPGPPTHSTNTSFPPERPFASAHLPNAFPPLSAPIRHHQSSASASVNTRPKSTSSSSKANDSTATGNAGFRNHNDCSPQPASMSQSVGPKTQNSDSPYPPTQRANSVEYVAFNHSQSDSRINDKHTDFAKQSRRQLATQRSASPKLMTDAVVSANLSVASNLSENIVKGDTPVLLERSPANSDGLVVHPSSSEPWQAPITRAVNSAGITGPFPRMYTFAIPNGPNGPRFHQHNHIPHVANMPENFPRSNFTKPVSCYNCGISGHYGEECPKKKPLDPDQAEKYCVLQRDAKLYPEKGRPFRQPGPHH